MSENVNVTIDNSLYLSWNGQEEVLYSVSKADLSDFLDSDYMSSSADENIEGNKVFEDNVTINDLTVNNFTSTTDVVEQGTENLFYTDLKAQQAMATLLKDTSDLLSIYDDINNTLELEIANGAIDANKIKANLNLSSKGFNAALVDGKKIDDSDNTTSSIWTSEQIENYVNIFYDKMDFQQSVLSSMTAAPADPNEGDRYYISGDGSGDWVGHSEELAEFRDGSWNFIVLDEGTMFWVEDTDAMIVIKGSGIEQLKDTVQHNDLSGEAGGNGTDEFFHLSSAEFDALTTSLNADSLHTHTSSSITDWTEKFNLEFDSKFASKNSDALSEGSNLFYSNSRVDARLKDLIQGNFNIIKDFDLATFKFVLNLDISNSTTTDLPEGINNLYYTDERVDDALSGTFQDGIGVTLEYDDVNNKLIYNLDLSELTTDDLPEGIENLYFSDERVAGSTTGVFHIEAGSSLQQGDIVTLYDDASVTKVKKADSTSADNEAFGFVKESFAVGDTATIFLAGFINNFTNLIPGKYYYLSFNNPGEITDTTPISTNSITQIVGKATSPSELKFFAEESLVNM